jgi:hypothetical protein
MNPIVEALIEANINGDEITDIVFTHLVFDHCGGLGSGAVGIGVAYSLINQVRFHFSSYHASTLLHFGNLQGLVSALALIDLAEEKVNGEVMDLQHGSAFMHEVDVRYVSFRLSALAPLAHISEASLRLYIVAVEGPIMSWLLAPN